MPPNTPCSHRVSLTDILGIIVIICLLPPRPGQVPREGVTTCRARNVEVFQPVEENIDIFRLENRWISSAPTATSDPLCGPDIPFTVPHSLSFPLPFPSDAPCGVRTALHRGACLLFAMTIPVPLSSGCAIIETFPETNSGISWLCSPPLTTELRVSWQSSLGILDNECVSCHVIKLST